MENNTKTENPTPGTVRLFLESKRSKGLGYERFPYHAWEKHVIGVYDDVKTLGEMSGLTRSEVDALRVAALYHDIAIPDGYKDHEIRSAEIARAELSGLGFDTNSIDRVVELIMGTKGEMVDDRYVTPPTDDLGVEIMRDADLASVGKAGYIERAKDLGREWGVPDIDEWVRSQVKFIEGHQFYTKVAHDLWGEQKMLNLEEVRNY